MIENFLKYIKEKSIDITNEQLDFWVSFFISRKLRKNTFLLRDGEVCKYTAFVLSGCLKLYSIDNKGKEHIIQFAPENWWISDMDSFTKGTPSQYFIETMEDSDVLLIDNPSFQKVLKKVPAVALFFQGLMQNRQTVTQKRIISSVSSSAEEQYFDFLKTYPSLAQRLPQHDIASYLGITPESLSRIRKQSARKPKA
jgi:CRP-like cAMP-binding protein